MAENETPRGGTKLYIAIGAVIVALGLGYLVFAGGSEVGEDAAPAAETPAAGADGADDEAETEGADDAEAEGG
jgi:hypothetical protein